MRNAVMPQLPKPEGGHGLTGPLPDALRVQNRARTYIQDKRGKDDPPEYACTAAGKGTDRTVWRRSLLTEDARGLGREAAAAFIALKKAFGTVEHALS